MLILLKIVLTVIAVIVGFAIFCFCLDHEGDFDYRVAWGCLIANFLISVPSLLVFVISLWGKFTNLLIISATVSGIFLIFSIVLRLTPLLPYYGSSRRWQRKGVWLFYLSIPFIIVFLWNKNMLLLVIPGSVCIISFIMLIVVNTKECGKSVLLMQNIKEMSIGKLRNAYFFLSEDLTMVRIKSQSENLSKSGKLKVDTENEIVHIFTTTKGKLLGINGGEIRIQFDDTEDCSLVFRYKPVCDYEGYNDDGSGRFWFSTNHSYGDEDIIVLYNKNEYHCYSEDEDIFLEFKLVKTNKIKNKKNIAKGAW